MAIDLSKYNTVAERIAEAKALYPDGHFESELVDLPAAFADKFIAVQATFHRTQEDRWPGVGMAWEPVPGKTPYTRDSELMNAETSAWGRALIAALIADASKGVASQDEVRNRQSTEQVIDEARTWTDRDKVCPDCNSGVYDNRDENRARLAKGLKARPAFKCKLCEWIAWDASTFDDKAGLVTERPDEAVVGDWSIPPPVPRDDYGPDEAPF